jgi:spermidine synthase
LTYYHPQGVLAETLHLLPANSAGRDIAIVGLGAGAQACNGQPTDRFTYFEIDGLVEKIARDPKLFTFMEKCSPDAKVVLGDARLTLADQPKTYDYLLLDAFSSDSIPVHLLTREAFKLYASRLNENGLLVLHISNRHMELESVVAALAKDAGLAIKGRILDNNSTALADPYPSSVMVLAKSPDTLNDFTAGRGWTPPATHDVSVWTDDYSNIPAAIWRKYRASN